MRLLYLLNQFFNWISAQKKWSLIFSAIVIKSIFFFAFAYLADSESFLKGIFWKIQGDANDYIEPIENLLSNGSFVTNNGSHAIRTPGLAPILLLFRLFLPLTQALNLLLFTQVALSGVSCYYLAKISERILNSKKAFGMTYVIFVLSTYVSIWNNYLLTESLASSFLIISIYSFFKAIDNEHKSYLLLSGFLLTWSIFLRPFLLPFIILLPFWLLLNNKKFFSASLIFLLPFVVIETSWVVRNYIFDGELVLLQSRKAYNDKGDVNKDLKLENFVGSFVASFGGDHTVWNPKGASNWFFNKANNGHHFPDVIFHDNLDFKKLQDIKAKCISIRKSNLSEEKKNFLENEVKEDLANYFYQYKNDHPVYFHIISRIKHFVRFNFHSGVYNLPFPSYQEQNFVQRLIKASYAILYLSVISCGILGSFIALIKWKETYLWLIVVAIPAYLLLLFPIVFKVHEYRLNTLAYPFLLILSVFFIRKAKEAYNSSFK